MPGDAWVHAALIGNETPAKIRMKSASLSSYLYGTSDPFPSDSLAVTVLRALNVFVKSALSSYLL